MFRPDLTVFLELLLSPQIGQSGYVRWVCDCGPRAGHNIRVVARSKSAGVKWRNGKDVFS